MRWAASFAGCQSESFGAALHVVDLLAIEIERHAQFHQRVDLALPCDDAFSRRLDVAQVPGADGRQRHAARPMHIDDAPRRQIALQRARYLLLDVGPRRVRDRGEFAMQVIHETDLL